MSISTINALGSDPRRSISGGDQEKSTEIATNSIAPKKRSKKLNFTLATSNVVVAAIIVFVIASGYRAPAEATPVTDNRSVLDQPAPSVDQIAAADVAASVAEVANLSVQTNVSSLAISLNAKTELAQTDNAFLSKPQIVSSATGRKGVTKYTTKAGDTIQSLASEFGVSEDTIRWANNLTSDNLSPGKELTIPGATGVLYTVKDGDDAQKLADKYHADKSRIITFNDAELKGLPVGRQILIPDGVLPENERPGYVAPRSTRTISSQAATASSTIKTGSFSGNGYAPGYCTWYAYNRRAELGRPIAGNWGNAVTWAAYARAAGFTVNNVPKAGAVIQNGGGWGGYGHVGVVERVNDDGSLLVSDMNYVGWNIISTRTVPAGSVGSYSYIH